jgi:hypothetical protein
MNIVIATFAFGQLLIQVLIGAWAEPCPMEVAFSIHDVRLTRCWPLDVQDHLLWPPSADIPVADWPVAVGSNWRWEQDLTSWTQPGDPERVNASGSAVTSPTPSGSSVI